MESMASISVHTQHSVGSIVKPANENMEGSTSQAWTGHLQNWINPISRRPARAPLSTPFRAWRWLLDWRWLTYPRNIILQGYFPMYLVPPSTSPISGTPRFWTGAPCWLWGSLNHQRNGYGRLVVRYKGSTSCRSDDCASHMHPMRITCPIVRVISMAGICNSHLVIFEQISAIHLKSMPGFSSDWSHVPRKVTKTVMQHGIPLLELGCLKLRILTSLTLAWYGIVQMDSSDNVTLCWLPGLGIIRNKSWLLKSHMAPARCVKFRKVRRRGIQLFYPLVTQETSIASWSCWRTIILMLFTL